MNAARLLFVTGGATITAGLLTALLWGQSHSQPAPIHFLHRPIDFVLNNCETDTRYAPETMAGGVALLDYNNDGWLDVFGTGCTETMGTAHSRM